MTAGIPFIDDGLEETVDDPFEICRQINVVHEPGTHYYYSNFSYALAGYFLALSVGVKDGITDFQNLAHLFLRLLQNKVLSPIGMNDAETEDFKLFRESGDKLGTGHARNEVGSAAMLPSGPVKGSVSDIASFLITEFQKGVSPMGLRVASSHQVTQRFNISSSLGYDWGMGWFRDRTHGFLHASGQWADNASGLMIDPETGLGLSFVLSVRDSTRLNYMDLDMDCLFIDLLNVLRQQQTI
jgi:CubicO group peptidase (beta-lactamase class C family)